MNDYNELFSLAPLGFPMYSITKKGDIWSRFANRFLVPKVHRDRYLFMRLQDQNLIWKNRYIHRLVALMFIPTSDTSLQIDHIDGNKINNRADNLRWVTNRENAHAAMQLGLMPHAVFPNDEVVHNICKMISDGVSIAEISRITGYSYDAIYAIRIGRNWTHISSQYQFPEMRPRHLIPINTVHTICKMIADGNSNSEIHKATQIKTELIGRIRNGENYKDISILYFK